ncbi:hypothetical protein LINPERPRIM_LOCUS7570, partial [Linum perenne]
ILACKKKKTPLTQLTFHPCFHSITAKCQPPRRKTSTDYIRWTHIMVDKGKAIVSVRDTSPPTPSRTPIQPIRSSSRIGRRSRFFSLQDE